jgi:hypothetical protein
MNPYSSTIFLLTALLIATNRKPIKTYLAWLQFKVKTNYKQRQNERRNQTCNRSRTIRS